MAKKNENKKNYSYNKKNERRPIEVYTKPFSTFEELANDICNIPGCMSSAAEDYFGDTIEVYIDGLRKETEYTESQIYNDLVRFLISEYEVNIANCVDNTNIFWSINTSIDRAFLKTGNSYGIGWIITRDDNRHIVSICATYKAYRPGSLKKEIKYLEENGWVLTEEK